jgi:Trk-type K+ transport system membrane component
MTQSLEYIFSACAWWIPLVVTLILIFIISLFTALIPNEKIQLIRKEAKPKKLTLYEILINMVITIIVVCVIIGLILIILVLLDKNMGNAMAYNCTEVLG